MDLGVNQLISVPKLNVPTATNAIAATMSNWVRLVRVLGEADRRGMIPIFFYTSRSSQRRDSNCVYISLSFPANYHLVRLGPQNRESLRIPVNLRNQRRLALDAGGRASSRAAKTKLGPQHAIQPLARQTRSAP